MTSSGKRQIRFAMRLEATTLFDNARVMVGNGDRTRVAELATRGVTVGTCVSIV